ASGLLADRRLGLAIGGLFGLPIGLLSGFTGVGGGEYRAPVLLVLLGRVRWAIAANLFIGLSVGLFNVIFRQAWTLPVEYLALALLLVPSSLPGAYVGVRITKHLSTGVLKGLLAGILIATGLRLILFEVRTGGSLSFDLSSIGLALVLGFALGVVCLGRSTQVLVTQVLGVAMILAAIRIVWDIRHPHPSEVLGMPERA